MTRLPFQDFVNGPIEDPNLGQNSLIACTGGRKCLEIGEGLVSRPK